MLISSDELNFSERERAVDLLHFLQNLDAPTVSTYWCLLAANEKLRINASEKSMLRHLFREILASMFAVGVTVKKRVSEGRL